MDYREYIEELTAATHVHLLGYRGQMGKPPRQVEAAKERTRACLGDDSANWPRHCVISCPPEFDGAVDVLADVAKLAVDGDVAAAISLLNAVPDLEMRSWFDEVAQNAGTVRVQLMGRARSTATGSGSSARVSLLNQAQVIREDGFHCRYCGIRLVEDATFRRLQRLIGYDNLPNRSRLRGRTKNTDVHGLWLMLRATVDHVEPRHSRGVTANERSNLVACCWPCNYAKWSYSLEDLAIESPFGRPPKVTGWEGLTDII